MDCRLFPDSVHKNAKCGDSKLIVKAKKNKGFSAHESTCKSGHIGNGYSCIKEPKDCENVPCGSPWYLPCMKVGSLTLIYLKEPILFSSI